jgi:hypothetical protein
MPEKPRYPLYELSGEEFEKLSFDLLAAADPNLSISTIESPRWIDAVGARKTAQGIQSVAIETSHRTTFRPETLRLFLERLSKEDQSFDEYIFITSSPIQDVHRRQFSRTLNAEVKVLGQAEIISLLNEYPTVAAKYFKSVRDRIRLRNILTFVSVLVFLTSIGVLANNFYSFLGSKLEPKSKLSQQVKGVEDSIAKLNDLEQSLRALKIDLQQKADESARVTREYERAMKLKSLTADQLRQIKKAVSSQSGVGTFLNSFLGFLLGIAASVLATVITDKWKQRRALAKPYA